MFHLKVLNFPPLFYDIDILVVNARQLIDKKNYLRQGLFEKKIVKYQLLM